MSLPLIPLGLMGGGGTIDFPTLRSTAVYEDSTFQFSHDITLGAGTTTGDFVLIFGRFAANLGTGVIDFPAPSGWERFANQNFGTAAELNAYWTIASGPMSSVTITRASGLAAATARFNAYTFSKHSHKAGRPPVISAIPEQLSTASPNPPELTVPAEWGSSPHVTWLSCLYKFGNSTTSSASSGYSNLIGTPDGDVRMASARQNIRAATEDPGAWTISAAHGGNPFCIAVRGPE